MTRVHQLPPEAHDPSAQQQGVGLLTAIGTGVAGYFAAHGGKWLFGVLRTSSRKEKAQTRAELVAEIRAEERTDARDEARLRIVEDKIIGVRAEVLMINDNIGKLYKGQNELTVKVVQMIATLKATHCPAAPRDKTDSD